VRGEGDTDGMRPLPSLGLDEPTPLAPPRGVQGEQPAGHDPRGGSQIG
jgi:hypothetical protein